MKSMKATSSSPRRSWGRASRPRWTLDRRDIINYLIDMRAVAKAADERKLSDSEDFKRHLEFARQRLLMDTLLNVEGKAALETDDAEHKVSDAQEPESPRSPRFTRVTSWSRPRMRQKPWLPN